MSLLVLDASVAIAWFVRSQATVAADAFAAEQISRWQLLAPDIFVADVTNVVLGHERRGRATSAQTEGKLAALADLAIDLGYRRVEPPGAGNFDSPKRAAQPVRRLLT